jgi:hypothetical protein
MRVNRPGPGSVASSSPPPRLNRTTSRWSPTSRKNSATPWRGRSSSVTKPPIFLLTSASPFIRAALSVPANCCATPTRPCTAPRNANVLSISSQACRMRHIIAWRSATNGAARSVTASCKCGYQPIVDPVNGKVRKAETLGAGTIPSAATSVRGIHSHR